MVWATRFRCRHVRPPKSNNLKCLSIIRGGKNVWATQHMILGSLDRPQFIYSPYKTLQSDINNYIVTYDPEHLVGTETLFYPSLGMTFVRDDNIRLLLWDLILWLRIFATLLTIHG